MSPFESAQKENQSNPSEKERVGSEEDYSKEFERRTLVVESVDPRNYTLEMRNEDLAYLDSWLRYELGRHKMLLRKHLEDLSKKISETNGDPLNRQEVVARAQEDLAQINKQFNARREEIFELKTKVTETFINKGEKKRDSEEEGKQKRETESKKEEKEPGEKENKKKPESENKEETQHSSFEIEKIASEELGITPEEYKVLTGRINIFDGPSFLRILEKVFGIKTTGKKEMRSAYYKLIKELHPDTGGTELEKEVKTAKIKVVNNLYGEYKKRYG